MIIFVCAYTHRGWTHRQRVSTFLTKRTSQIFLVLLTGFQPRAFGSSVWRSTNWAIPFKFFIYSFRVSASQCDHELMTLNTAVALIFMTMSIHVPVLIWLILIPPPSRLLHVYVHLQRFVNQSTALQKQLDWHAKQPSSWVAQCISGDLFFLLFFYFFFLSPETWHVEAHETL